MRRHHIFIYSAAWAWPQAIDSGDAVSSPVGGRSQAVLTAPTPTAYPPPSPCSTSRHLIAQAPSFPLMESKDGRASATWVVLQGARPSESAAVAGDLPTLGGDYTRAAPFTQENNKKKQTSPTSSTLTYVVTTQKNRRGMFWAGGCGRGGGGGGGHD